MVVGTYTDAGSQGLYSFSFDQSTGKASGITSLKVDNPSYFTFSKDGRNIYAVSEKNNATAVLNSIGYDPVNGTFAFKNSQPSLRHTAYFTGNPEFGLDCVYSKYKRRRIKTRLCSKRT